MPEISVEKYVAAPPATVFEYATDLRRAPERITGIKSLEVLTDGPIRKGTRFRETRVMFGRKATEEMEIVAFDPARSYAVGCENHGCRYHTEFRFVPEGSGTRMAVRFEGTALTFLARMMLFLMAPMIKSCAKAFDKDMEELKVAIERDHAKVR